MTAKKKRQYSKISVVYIMFGVALITVMTVIGTSAFLRAKEIIVKGASMYSVEKVVESSGLSPGDNLMFINAQNITGDIRKALPFVSAASITRIPPDTILIEITESEAVASISFFGDLIVIDPTGRVLARLTGGNQTLHGVDLDNLINIRGLEIDDAVEGSIIKPVFGSEIKLQYVQDILAALEREKLTEDVSYIDVSNIANVNFGYLVYRVILGGSTSLRPSNIRNNLNRMLMAVPEIQRVHPNTGGPLDVSDETKPPSFKPS